jgi:glycosyltransferase involved in cell wall biosynthesis
VSVVVPVRDERATLGTLFRALGRQTRPPDEIVVVDGGSADGSGRLARELAAGDPRVTVIEVGPGTPGHNRNVGIESARHEVIALLDAGTEPGPTWLAELVTTAVAEPEAEAVFGSYDPAPVSGFTRLAAMAFVAPGTPTPHGPLREPSFASALLRREAWRRAGGFPDLRAAEDGIFLERLAGAGVRSARAPRARVLWYLPDSLGGVFRRFRSYSRHNVEAGRQEHWHHGVLRLYVGAAALAALGTVRSPRWLALLGAGAWGRAWRSVRRSSPERGLMWSLNPARTIGVLVVLVVVDAGTFAGWIEALARRRRA